MPLSVVERAKRAEAQQRLEHVSSRSFLARSTTGIGA